MIYVFLFLLFCLALFCLVFYDDISFFIAEVFLLERSRVVAYTATGAHLRVSIEGRNHDVWINYDPASRASMRSVKVIADGNPLSFLPGCLPPMTVEEMGYKKVTIKVAGKKSIKFKGQEVLNLKSSAEDKK